MNDQKLQEDIERYVDGDMTAEERKAFDQFRKGNTTINNKIAEHKAFIKTLKQYSDRLALEGRLNAIHDEIDVHTMVEELMLHPSWVVRLWRNHHSKISVAASIAIFAVLSVMFLTGKMSNQDSKYIELKGQVAKIQTKTDRLSQKINQGNRSVTNDINKFRGTGFAITSGGLLVTNYHVVSEYDSVSVQNAAGVSFKAKVLFTEPENDIAILKIVDTAFKTLGPIPYTFKKTASDLAESVYTYGYPQDSPVYGKGEVTSANGLNGDSLEYQISVPVNPGNSGGPLMDNKGNVIGIVQAKQTQMEGVHFAVKTSYLLSALDSLDQKVTLNTKNTMSTLTPVQQLKKLKNYVFMVKVYDK